jgi:hypothetical protein
MIFHHCCHKSITINPYHEFPGRRWCIHDTADHLQWQKMENGAVNLSLWCIESGFIIILMLFEFISINIRIEGSIQAIWRLVPLSNSCLDVDFIHCNATIRFDL